jgi:hypothetical protein
VPKFVGGEGVAEAKAIKLICNVFCDRGSSMVVHALVYALSSFVYLNWIVSYPVRDK